MHTAQQIRLLYLGSLLAATWSTKSTLLQHDGKGEARRQKRQKTVKRSAPGPSVKPKIRG